MEPLSGGNPAVDALRSERRLLVKRVFGWEKPYVLDTKVQTT
jgi:hypothetical protein